MPASTGFSLDDIAARSIDSVLAEVSSQAAALFLLDDEGGSLRLHTRRGGSNALFGDLPQLLPGPLRKVEIVPGRPGSSIAFLAVPLRSRNRFCGLIAVQLTREAGISPAVRRRLQQIGDRAGELIESANLSSAIVRRNEQLQTLCEAGIAISSDLDLDVVLQRVTDLAR
ncbi:MAG TPA: hypothetical protein VNL92_07200, partial [Dehalococcoidia bacterium]|nr:hypothetical protein [Dehalococcoidia bacterium]